jgi:hypothetical protein
MLVLVVAASPAFADQPQKVVVTNTNANPVPVNGNVVVTGTTNVNVTNASIPVTGTVGISGTPTVNVGSMPALTVQNAGTQAFVIPYDFSVSGGVRVALPKPATLEAVSFDCQVGAVDFSTGVQLQLSVDSAGSFALPTGVQLYQMGFFSWNVPANAPTIGPQITLPLIPSPTFSHALAAPVVLNGMGLPVISDFRIALFQTAVQLNSPFTAGYVAVPACGGNLIFRFMN